MEFRSSRGKRVSPTLSQPLSLCVVLVSAVLLSRRAEAQQATIPNLGKIQGMTCPGYANASMFLGIPYATAQRWKPPQLWRHAYTAPYLPATDFPPACPQRAKEQYQLAEVSKNGPVWVADAGATTVTVAGLGTGTRSRAT